MTWTQHGEVNNILDRLLDGHRRIFGDKLVGFYLYGSLVWGDFDIASSDIDTLCVIASEITHEEMKLLDRLHVEIANQNPLFRDRIEVHYASRYGLKYVREFPSKMGNISPGEPLHIIDASIDWLVEWYCVQEYAITLFGVDKSEVIPYIDKSEFIQQTCNYARSFKERIQESKGNPYSQAYIILTLCRALYTLKNGEQISKPGAARWAADFLPEYRELITHALAWRRERKLTDPSSLETYTMAKQFTDEMIERFF